MKKFRDVGSISQFIDINITDVIKGFIVAVMSASLTALYNFLTTGVVLGNEQRKFIMIAGVTAGLGYLLKNVFTNSQGQFFTMEPKPVPAEPTTTPIDSL